jgi:hypothetical protein
VAVKSAAADAPANQIVLIFIVLFFLSVRRPASPWEMTSAMMLDGKPSSVNLG